jgi:hypothetical protein
VVYVICVTISSADFQFTIHNSQFTIHNSQFTIHNFHPPTSKPLSPFKHSQIPRHNESGILTTKILLRIIHETWSKPSKLVSILHAVTVIRCARAVRLLKDTPLTPFYILSTCTNCAFVIQNLLAIVARPISISQIFLVEMTKKLKDGDAQYREKVPFLYW